MTSSNAEIMQQPDSDGALIGGAALDGQSYGEMVRITSGVYGGWDVAAAD